MPSLRNVLSSTEAEFLPQPKNRWPETTCEKSTAAKWAGEVAVGVEGVAYG